MGIGKGLERLSDPLPFDPKLHLFRNPVMSDLYVSEAHAYVPVRTRLRRSHTINGPAVSDGKYPRSSLPLVRSELGCGLPDLEENLLQDLFALRTIDEHTKDEAEYAGGEQVVEARKCGFVALRDARQQLADMVDAFAALLGHVYAVDNHMSQHASPIAAPRNPARGMDNGKTFCPMSNPIAEQPRMAL